MRRLAIAILLAAVVALSGVPHAGAHGSAEGESVSDLTHMTEEANLVFVGDVVDVVYRKARIEGGEGDLPYTFVTYAVGNVLRGEAPGDTLTMGFPGGPNGRGGFVEVSSVPLFQRGERDLLFVVGNGEKGCALVNCEWGRFRILNEGVYNTHGSPVRGLVQEHAIARGLPAEEFRRFSYPAPSFDEVMKNPEARRALKEQNLSVEEARRRYEAEAPKQIEVRARFPETGDGGLDALASEEHGAGPSALPQVPEEAKLGRGRVPLAEFLATVRQVAAKARRAPAELESIDRDAEIVFDLTPRAPSSPPEPEAAAVPKTPQEEAELKALAAQGFDPVIKH